MSDRPRILCVLNELPWPPHGGYRARSLTSLEGLCDVGDVDLLVVGDAPGCLDSPDPTGRLERVDVVHAPVTHEPRRVLRWVFGADPRAVVWRDWEAARQLLAGRGPGSYDVAWYGQSEVARGLADVVRAPTIVDLDDLQWVKVAHRLGNRLGGTRARRSGGGARAAIARLLDRVDQRRWARLQRCQARRVDAVVVCSDLDRRRLAAANAAVIPNGYRAPSDVPCRAPVGDRIVMVGVFSYEPNRTGAELFVDAILPRVRARRPDAELRLVGRGGDALAPLAGTPGVTIVGEVPDVLPELAQSALAVVPLVTGGGTRIKIIEAFATGVPVVSTSVGCEGLDAVDGEHLLIADDVERFTECCVGLLEQPELGRRLREAARLLYERRFRADQQRPAVSELVLSVLSATR